MTLTSVDDVVGLPLWVSLPGFTPRLRTSFRTGDLFGDRVSDLLSEDDPRSVTVEAEGGTVTRVRCRGDRPGNR